MFWGRLSANIHFSPWPMQTGLSVLGGITSLVVLLKTGRFSLFFFCLVCLSIRVSFWSSDIVWEGRRGEYSLQVYDNFKFRFSLFVFREIILLFSFFWTLFHFSLAPSSLARHTWPPLGVETIAPRGVPLLNTILLVGRGVTVTWAHHLLMCGFCKERREALGGTVFLGVIFLFNQGVEFREAIFSLGERVYGCLFFTLTGFHGFHVFLGLFLLLVGRGRLFLTHLTCVNHASLEISFWYWHLVDCVWLIVYSFIYWWGN